jgi:hypothetical protein
MARYVVCTLIDVPEMDLSNPDEVDAMLVNSLGPEAIKSAWIYQIKEDFETVGPMQ